MPGTDACDGAATRQQPLIKLKRAASKPAFAPNQIENQDDDGNHEQQMNQTAANVNEQAKQPQYEQDDNYCPQHGVIPFPLS
jgi:hypothetical protein